MTIFSLFHALQADKNSTIVQIKYLQKKSPCGSNDSFYF